MLNILSKLQFNSFEQQNEIVTYQDNELSRNLWRKRKFKLEQNIPTPNI